MFYFLWFIIKWLRRREWAGSDLPEAREEDVDSQGTGSSSFHQGVLAVVQAKQQRDTQDLLVTLQRGAAVAALRGAEESSVPQGHTNTLKDPVSEGASTHKVLQMNRAQEIRNASCTSHCCKVRT